MSISTRYLSTVQAGERLSISREHVRRLIQRGELRAEETVNGFMLDAFEVDQYAIQRRVLQDQRQFRMAVDDLATQARRVDEATGIQSAVAQMRDQMKLHPAFEVPAAVAPQLQWIEQEVVAQKALAALAGPAETIMEQWRRYDEDARRAMEHVVSSVSASEKMMLAMNEDSHRAMEQAVGDVFAHDKALQAMNRDAQQAKAKVMGTDADAKAQMADAIGPVGLEAQVAAGYDQVMSAESMYQRQGEPLRRANAISPNDPLLKREEEIRAIRDGGAAGAWLRQQERLADLLATNVRPEDSLMATFSNRASQINLGDPGVIAAAAALNRERDHMAALARKDDPLASTSFAKPPMEVVARPPEMARGFVVPESREARLEEKMDELNHKVEQLTELVMQQHADTTTMDLPAWQEWAGSARPEDVLAKLDAIREEVTGGKQAGENSTDVIRAAREARGQDG